MIKDENSRVIYYLTALKAAKENGMANFSRFHDFMKNNCGYTKKKLDSLQSHVESSGYVDTSMDFVFPHNVNLREIEDRQVANELRITIKHYLDEFQERMKRERDTGRKKRKAVGISTKTIFSIDFPKIKLDYGPSTPPAPISGIIKNLVDIDYLSKAIRLAIDEDMEYEVARDTAEHVLGFFGFQTAVVDNILEPPDRNVFYMMQDWGLLNQTSEEGLLYDGRTWRIHWWYLTEKVDELAQSEEMTTVTDAGQEIKEDFVALYSEVFSRLYPGGDDTD